VLLIPHLSWVEVHDVDSRPMGTSPFLLPVGLRYPLTLSVWPSAVHGCFQPHWSFPRGAKDSTLDSVGRSYADVGHMGDGSHCSGFPHRADCRSGNCGKSTGPVGLSVDAGRGTDTRLGWQVQWRQHAV